MTQKRVPASLAIFGFAFLLGLNASATLAFDPTKLHCVRQERQGDQIFLSEIRFFNSELVILNEPGQSTSGELVSYSIRGTKKSYVSGYSFYSVTYENRIISGLTGDPNTRADGSFTLSKTTPKFNGDWNFTYSNTKGEKIDAVFKCIYKNKIKAQF